ncbi:hypothetical protein C0995_006536, partial [Termitomyces sp. Mi166
MGSASSTFVADICRAKGHIAEPLQPSKGMRDARETGWGELVSSFVNDPKLGSRASAKARVGSGTTALASPTKGIIGPEGPGRSKKRKISKDTLLKYPPQWNNITVPSRQ